MEGLDREIRQGFFEGLFVHENVMNSRIEGFCQRFRRGDPATVIVACLRTANGNEAGLFEAGVDDVVTELTPVNAIVKRICLRLRERTCLRDPGSILRIAGIIVDTQAFKVRTHGKCREISEGLVKLLLHFARNPGRTVSRKEAAQAVWVDAIVDPKGKNLDMHVMKLRRLIEHDPRNPTLLQTVRGVGYVFRPNGREA